jgi:hypothetical protein
MSKRHIWSHTKYFQRTAKTQCRNRCMKWQRGNRNRNRSEDLKTQGKTKWELLIYVRNPRSLIRLKRLRYHGKARRGDLLCHCRIKIVLHLRLCSVSNRSFGHDIGLNTYFITEFNGNLNRVSATHLISYLLSRTSPPIQRFKLVLWDFLFPLSSLTPIHPLPTHFHQFNQHPMVSEGCAQKARQYDYLLHNGPYLVWSTETWCWQAGWKSGQ